MAAANRKELVQMTRQRHRTATAAAALLAALGIGAGGAVAILTAVDSGGTTTVVRQVAVGSNASTASTAPLSVNQIYRRASRAVVEITVTSTSSSGFGGQTQQGLGTGFVIDELGHVVTNQHVVSDAETVTVRFSNGATYKGTVVGSDASTDIAVVKVDAPASLLVPLTFANSADVEVGDGVVAIGSPFGLEETVTSGIVSALHRQMTAPNNFAINDSIQTDAAINHGNSGGPLLDNQARVIGVNAQIQSDSGGSDGVGFAIPSSTVKSIAQQIIASGKVEHAYLGVGVASLPETVASRLNSPAGVALTEVRPSTPAAQAGLKAATGEQSLDGQTYPTGGDVVTEIDGRAVTSAAELQSAIDAHKPGDTIALTVVRDGDTRTVRVKLAIRPA
jgi:S1-C subfamily serine protease